MHQPFAVTVRSKATYEASDAQRAVQRLVHHFALLLLDLRVLWQQRLRGPRACHVVDFPDPKVIQRLEQDDPHDVVRCVACAYTAATIRGKQWSAYATTEARPRTGEREGGHTCGDSTNEIPFRLEVAGHPNVLQVFVTPLVQLGHKRCENVDRNSVRLCCWPP